MKIRVVSLVHDKLSQWHAIEHSLVACAVDDCECGGHGEGNICPILRGRSGPPIATATRETVTVDDRIEIAIVRKFLGESYMLPL